MSTQQQTVDSERGQWTSASSAHWDMLCVGRHLAQRGIPEPEKDKDADRGSRIHAALAGQIGVETLALEERETFDACRDIEKKLVSQYFGDTSAANNGPGRLRVFREERYWGRIIHNGATLEHSAKPDVVYRSGLKALVIEYKTLAGEIPDSPRNSQLRDQAVLVRGNFVTVNEVACAVVQPYVTHEPTLCQYDLAALGKASDEMWQRVIASNTPNQPRTPGEAQCKFCRAQRTCPEYQKWAGAMLPPAMLSVLEVPMQNWTPEQRAFFLERSKMAEKFIEDGKAFIKEGLAKDPTFCPGYTLKPGSVRRDVTDTQACFDRFAALGGKIEQFMPAVKVGLTKLKEAMNGVTGAKGVALDKAMKTLLDGICTEKQAEPSLIKVKEDAA